jgi:HEAT repeat protein
LARDALDAIGNATKEERGSRANQTHDVEKLVRDLQNPDFAVRQAAVDVLKELGRKASKAVPALINALHDFNRHVRVGAADALGAMGAEASRAEGPLLKILQTEPEDFFIYIPVALALGRIRPDQAKEAIPTLLKALKNDTFRVDAAATLAELSPEHRRMAAMMLSWSLRRSTDVFKAGMAAEKLGQLNAKESQQALEDALEDTDKSLRTEASNALLKMGS